MSEAAETEYDYGHESVNPDPSILDEITDATVAQRTISSMAIGDAEGAAGALAELVEKSIRSTHAEDWVSHDEGQTASLQAVGCARLRPMWRITFDDVDLDRDFSEKRDGKNVSITAVARGKCGVTGERVTAFNRRNTKGFFAKKWGKAGTDEIAQDDVLMDVQKAAYSGAQGRLIREVTGTEKLPVSLLEKFGIDAAKIKGVKYRKGTQGGSGNFATDPDVREIALLAVDGYRVSGVTDIDSVESIVGQRKLSKDKADKLIEKLRAREEPISLQQFGKAIGHKPWAEAPEEAEPQGDEAA